MNSRGLAWILLLAPALAFACGGKTGSGSGDGGPGSSSSSGGTGSGSGGSSGGSSGSSSGGEPVDATPVLDSPAPIVCMGGPTTGSSSGSTGSCDVIDNETCTDGYMYNVDCQCPAGACFCTQTGMQGGSSGGGFSYPGCPDCTQRSNLFTICGFPQ